MAHLKDPIYKCLEPEVEGCGMTFRLIQRWSKYPKKMQSLQEYKSRAVGSSKNKGDDTLWSEKQGVWNLEIDLANHDSGDKRDEIH